MHARGILATVTLMFAATAAQSGVINRVSTNNFYLLTVAGVTMPALGEQGQCARFCKDDYLIVRHHGKRGGSAYTFAPYLASWGKASGKLRRYVEFFDADASLYDRVTREHKRPRHETPPPPQNTVNIPEPGTVALFGLGLVGLIISRRRINKH